MGVVGAEGCQLSVCVWVQSHKQHKSYGDQRGCRHCCDDFCTQSLIRPWQAGGYRQGRGNSLSLVSGDSFRPLKDLLGAELFCARPWLWGE